MPAKEKRNALIVKLWNKGKTNYMKLNPKDFFL